MAVITTHLTTHSGVKDVYIAENDKYAIIATFSGIEYINLYTGELVSSGIVPGNYEPMCVAADWTTATGLVYVGTSGGGIFSTRYHPARNPGSDFSGSLVQHFYAAGQPPLSSDIITDLDILPGQLLIGTNSGIDFISISNSLHSARALISGTEDVHLTATGGGYWTTASSVEVNYHLLSTTGTGIIVADFEYTILSDPPIPFPKVTDIAIGGSNPRILAFATTSGVLVAEERPFFESTAQRKIFVSLNEFEEPQIPAIISADFSNSPTFDSGLLYATTTGVLRVFSLAGNAIIGNHPMSFEPEYDLTGGVARDQTLVTGTIHTVRTTSLA